MKNLANNYYKPLAKNFININNPTLSLINLALNKDDDDIIKSFNKHIKYKDVENSVLENF